MRRLSIFLSNLKNFLCGARAKITLKTLYTLGPRCTGAPWASFCHPNPLTTHAPLYGPIFLLAWDLVPWASLELSFFWARPLQWCCFGLLRKYDLGLQKVWAQFYCGKWGGGETHKFKARKIQISIWCHFVPNVIQILQHVNRDLLKDYYIKIKKWGDKT